MVFSDIEAVGTTLWQHMYSRIGLYKDILWQLDMTDHEACMPLLCKMAFDLIAVLQISPICSGVHPSPLSNI